MKYLITSVAVIGLGFLILLAQSLSNTDLVSNDTFIVLLVISIAFVVCLFLLIIFQVFKLLQSVRKEITGSKLTLRLVIAFGLMVLIPVSIVYLVSVNFLTKSIGAKPIFINQPAQQDYFSEKLFALNYSLIHHCEKKVYNCINLVKELKATNDFWWDGVHTTPKGSRAVADKIFPKLINFLN